VIARDSAKREMIKESMSNDLKSASPLKVRYTVADRVTIVGDAYGSDCNHAVLLAHGGGQTRHAWGNTAMMLAQHGWHAISLDLRGHGESDWHPSGDYRIEAYAEDLRMIAGTFDKPPILIGASLGGVSGLIAQAEGNHTIFSAIILVDVAHRAENKGAKRILHFMKDRMEKGFSDVEEAVDAVVSYLPHRDRAVDRDGLMKNLRLRPDGRYYWHWDPNIAVHGDNLREEMLGSSSRFSAAARSLQIPTLLVRGRMSDVLSKDIANEFLKLVPHAKLADVQGAGHMIAGDRNDLFSESILSFLNLVSQAI